MWINAGGCQCSPGEIGNVKIRSGNAPKEGLNVTAALIPRSSIVAFCLVVGVSISSSVETIKLMDQASTDGSIIIAQTNGQDRRANRQDCRQEGGLVGKDKRDCKQEGRTNN